MRFLRSLLAVGLSTVVSASSLPSHDLSSVYYSPEIPTSAEIPTLTSSQFTLALAHRLGLSIFHTLNEADIDAVSKVKVVNPVVELLGGNGKGNIVVHIGGVDRGFMEGIKPVFNVASQSARIDKSILAQAEEVMGFKLQPTWVCDDDTEAKDRIEILSRDYVYTVSDSLKWGNSLEEDIIDLVGPRALAQFDFENPKHRVFLTDFGSLMAILGSNHILQTAVSGGEYVFISIPILKWLEPNSEAYAVGVDLLSSYFKSLLSSDDPVTLLVGPAFQTPYYTRSVDFAAPELKKRREIPISFSHPQSSNPQEKSIHESNPPISFTSGSRIPRIFPDQEECEATTSSCSSHGSCVKSDYPIKGSWTCKCNATETKTKSGVVKTYWAGNACQKEDISVQFHLIFIFTIILVLAIAAVINAMMRMGSEELPSVLTAGTPAKKQ